VSRLLLGLVILGLLMSLNGCGQLKAGECVQNINDKHIWRITAARLNGYTVQEWVNGKWSAPVDITDISYRSDYVKISCPS